MSCDKHFAYCSQSVNESNEHGRVTRTQPAEKNVNVIVFDARQKRLYILQGAEGKNGPQEQEKQNKEDGAGGEDYICPLSVPRAFLRHVKALTYIYIKRNG